MTRIRQAKFMEKRERPQFSSYRHKHKLISSKCCVCVHIGLQIISDINVSQVFNR